MMQIQDPGGRVSMLPGSTASFTERGLRRACVQSTFLDEGTWFHLERLLHVSERILARFIMNAPIEASPLDKPGR
jgi:hypothetical protein